MSKTITTTALKPHMGPDGVIVQVGDTITIDETRHRQLVRRGYVPKGDTDEADGEKPHRDGITNSDFEPRRQSIVGEDHETAAKAKPKPVAKAKQDATEA